MSFFCGIRKIKVLRPTNLTRSMPTPLRFSPPCGLQDSRKSFIGTHVAPSIGHYPPHPGPYPAWQLFSVKHCCNESARRVLRLDNSAFL